MLERVVSTARQTSVRISVKKTKGGTRGCEISRHVYQLFSTYSCREVASNCGLRGEGVIG